MDDTKIVDLYWARSESAIDETSKKYGGYCKGIARNILYNEQDSEECVNDAYLGAWNAMPPQRPTRLPAFLGRITRNIAMDKLDYKTAQKRQGEFGGVLSELEDCLVSPQDVESEVEAEEVGRAISSFLRAVNADKRNVFLRRYWYADSIGEIARRFHMSESKVKSMLLRTRRELRDYLEKEGTTL